MNLEELRDDLSVRCKNGISFLIAGTLIWTIITILFLQSFDLTQKNIFTLFATGLMMPLSLLATRLIKAEFSVKNNPINQLGIFLNIAQLMYFPLLYWAFVENPEGFIVFFAVITGAHFFPYGWSYHTKAYYVMAPVISIVVTILGLNVSESYMWMVPFAVVLCLLVLIGWLLIDYKQKVSTPQQPSLQKTS
ncbi:hypothetical protein NC661_18130 [Aquibacillus koreensis]|uniref:Uncharacterized protein n=1 Tax=Aquibacillus koreensis TaxID=279446 RepID=A0A9X4AJI1_9BACI|nr:hypothetical protein [Aquibacillus koreensis]MCT2535437.1 hypothetical protein [Aquibacillus koreensis]MDC3422272.1 hypothetical protein [Aquibacillus koreensis]